MQLGKLVVFHYQLKHGLRTTRKVPTTSVENIARSAAHEAHGTKEAISGTRRRTNTARNAHRMIQRLGLRWRIPISEIDFDTGEECLKLPYLSPIEICKFLIGKHPEVLCGGFREDSDIANLLGSWWENYGFNHPGHAVGTSDMQHDRAFCIPISLYGDEGRGRRRGNTALVTMEATFGLHTAVNAREQNSCCGCDQCDPNEFVKAQNPAHGEPEKFENDLGLVGFATTNVKEHSFLSKVPLFLLPCTLYKKHAGLIEHMLEQIVKELRQLFYEGLYIRNKTWSIAVLGMKGDMKWHAECFNLCRYYAKRGRKRALSMCPECEAGKPGFPYEDLRAAPAWKRTCYRTRPWVLEPVLAALPCDAKAPEKMIRRDIFHLTKLGLYRHFVASTLVLLVHWRYFKVAGESNAAPEQLVRAHGCFRLWCLTFHKTPALRSFTRNLLMWKNNSTFPWMNAKGSDVMLVLGWLADYLPILTREARHPEHKQIMEIFLEVARHMLAFTKSLNTHFLLYSRRCCLTLFQHGNAALTGYAWLAEKSLPLNVCAFALVPKVHMVKHTVVELQDASQWPKGLLLSPMIFACETNEDVIGKICRLSRRTDGRTMEKRVLEMYLTKAFLLHKRAMARLELWEKACKP